MQVSQTKIPSHIKHQFTFILRLVMLYRTFMFLVTGNMKHLFFSVEGGLRFSVDEMDGPASRYWVVSKRDDEPNLHSYKEMPLGFERTRNYKLVSVDCTIPRLRAYIEGMSSDRDLNLDISIQGNIIHIERK
jgi:hypothetical protein